MNKFERMWKKHQAKKEKRERIKTFFSEVLACIAFLITIALMFFLLFILEGIIK